MRKFLFSVGAALFVIRQDGIPMTVSNVSADELQAQGYQIVDKQTYDDVVASLPASPIVNQGPSFEDQIVALEAHQSAQDVAISAVAVKTGTPISLPVSQVQEVP